MDLIMTQNPHPDPLLFKERGEMPRDDQQQQEKLPPLPNRERAG
jgi:hypothetical protein